MIRSWLDSPAFYFVVAAILVAIGVGTQVVVELPKRPQGDPSQIRSLADRDDLNLVFVVVDTLRSDRLGSYGYDRDTSPTLDAMARTGIKFQNVESQSSWTKESMASLWTGMYPRTTRVDHFSDSIPDEAVMPAEILKDAGFVTGGVYRNGWVMPNFGFGQGFDLYIRPHPRMRENQMQANSLLNRRVVGNDLDVTESAIEFIRSNRENRFFLYLHLMDVHQYLYDDASSLFGTGYSDIYDNSIHWVDRNFKALLVEMEELGIADRTVVVVASDHGEAFSEHGVEGHAKNLFREVQEVPLILYLPFFLEPGLDIRTTVANIDIWPTLLDLLGLPSLPGAEGRSLLPLIEAAAGGDESDAGDLATRPVFSQLNKVWGQPETVEQAQLVAVRDGPYRFVRLEPQGTRGLFNREEDPREIKNLGLTEPEKADELTALVKQFLEEAEPAWDSDVEVEISEMRLGQLRALGYSIPQLRNPKRKGEEGEEESGGEAEPEAP
ncbi:MAG: sulfatase [Myxococcota bacterium]|nr:sulfatase [Myxococcota bacterium]